MVFAIEEFSSYNKTKNCLITKIISVEYEIKKLLYCCWFISSIFAFISGLYFSEEISIL